jgi:hypothetical protein
LSRREGQQNSDLWNQGWNGSGIGRSELQLLQKLEFSKQLTKTFVETLIDVGEKANKQFELKVILN